MSNQNVNRIIWICWFQGWETAPFLVRQCRESWISRNPGWDVRAIDASSVRRYLDIDDYVALGAKEITAASLSDIVRVLLLREYGGVWVDATAYCIRPLDDWLANYMGGQFFAFRNPEPYLQLSTWFLARTSDDATTDKWAARVIGYWAERERADNYFWFHILFNELVASDPQVAEAWSRVPQLRLDGPLGSGPSADAPDPAELADAAAWEMPLIKLSHRIDPAAWAEGTELGKLLRSHVPPPQPLAPRTRAGSRPAAFVGLKTRTANLGDHIQIVAAERLLARADISIGQRIDRDDEIASAPSLDGGDASAGVLLNGWYKTNPEEWPPNPRLSPIYLGFHIRLFQSPSLIGPEAIEHYRAHEPIGCRDEYTRSLLSSLGVDCFVSNCLTLTFPRRLPDPARQTEVFVVSTDKRLLELVPAGLGETQFVSHYSGTADFESNLASAEALLKTYRERARLIVTTFLHCALPAIAMGIPVVVFYPLQDGFMHGSDRERFSSLAAMIRVHQASEAAKVDWSGQRVDVAQWKLKILDALFEKAAIWNLPPPRAIGPIAPPEALPVPE